MYMCLYYVVYGEPQWNISMDVKMFIHMVMTIFFPQETQQSNKQITNNTPPQKKRKEKLHFPPATKVFQDNDIHGVFYLLTGKPVKFAHLLFG